MPRAIGAFLFSVEFRDDFDFPQDVLIELFQLFCGDPVFEMRSSAYLLYRKL